MTKVGMFGKIPAYGDFLSMGSGSVLHRAFERWLEDCNDVLAARHQELSKDPLGLMIRGEDSTSMLVGILVGSCDSVGRTFPLGMFHELSTGNAVLAGLPLAMASDLGRLAMVARNARPPAQSRQNLEALLQATQRTDDDAIAIRTHAELHRLRILKASVMLERVFGPDPWPYYAIDVIERACTLADERRGKTPLLLQGRVKTDVELMFLLAILDAMSDGRLPAAVIWDVSRHRALFVLGAPDSWLLALMVESSDVDRLWPMTTERIELAHKAEASIDPRLRAALNDAKVASAKDFVTALAGACKSKRPQAISKEKRSLWRSKDQ